MRAEELTLVRNTQAEIARRLKLEQEIQDLEHSLKVEWAWILTLRKSLEELDLVAQIRQRIAELKR